MLVGDRPVPPLPSDDIKQILQGIFTDTSAPPDLAIEAFAVTAASLYGWCNAPDIDQAVSSIGPAARLLEAVA